MFTSCSPRILFLISFQIISFIAEAQMTQQWNRQYDRKGGSDQAKSMVTDASGNVYVTGNSQGAGDFFTVKYSSSGVQQWTAAYGTGVCDAAPNSIAVDGSGNVYVTGWSSGFLDYVTVKYNTDGVQQWVAVYSGGGSNYAGSVAVDGSGNVYVTGSANSQCATIKYDAVGVQQWVANYTGAGGYDEGDVVKVDGSGNVYVTGYSYALSGYPDYITLKYNTAGVQQWATIFNGPGNDVDRPSSMAIDGSGNVYVTGQTWVGAMYHHYATLRQPTFVL